VSHDSIRAAIDELSATSKAGFARVEPERLKAFLEDQEDVAGPVELSELDYLTTGPGASNGIAFFKATFNRAGRTTTESLVLRYAPGRQLLNLKSFQEEFLTMRVLERHDVLAPRAYWLDADGSQLGHAGFVGTRMKGSGPPSDYIGSGPLSDLSGRDRRALLLDIAGFHGDLQARAIDADTAAHLLTRGSGATAVERELSWWRAEALSHEEPGGPHLQELDRAYAWLIAHQPSGLRSASLTHGDSQISNHLVAEGRLTGVVDWEFAHLGYGETDLALIVYLAGWARRTNDEADGIPTEDEFVRRYEAESGRTLQAWNYFKAFIRFKAATATLASRQLMPAFDAVWKAQTASLRTAIDEAGKDH
jgi:aminoglycoside phosphotransferase (APT) family kinase protein